MSGKRKQNTSGNLWVFIIPMLVGWSVIWSAPLWVHHFFPNFIIWSHEPWELTVADLTWQRTLSNLVVKPGFRLVIGGLYGIVIFVFQLFLMDRSIRRKTAVSKSNWLMIWRQESGEFVIDGRRVSPIIEYARAIDAI